MHQDRASQFASDFSPQAWVSQGTSQWKSVLSVLIAWKSAVNNFGFKIWKPDFYTVVVPFLLKIMLPILQPQRQWCTKVLLSQTQNFCEPLVLGSGSKRPWQLFPPTVVGPYPPSTAGTFRMKFRKNSGKTPETLSERFLEFLSRVRLGCPKPYNSRHLRLPEHFQNYLPPSTAGGASFFRSGSGEGLPELVMEFPAVLGVFLSSGV